VAEAIDQHRMLFLGRQRDSLGQPALQVVIRAVEQARALGRVAVDRILHVTAALLHAIILQGQVGRAADASRLGGGGRGRRRADAGRGRWRGDVRDRRSGFGLGQGSRPRDRGDEVLALQWLGNPDGVVQFARMDRQHQRGTVETAPHIQPQAIGAHPVQIDDHGLGLAGVGDLAAAPPRSVDEHGEQLARAFIHAVQRDLQRRLSHAGPQTAGWVPKLIMSCSRMAARRSISPMRR